MLTGIYSVFFGQLQKEKRICRKHLVFVCICSELMTDQGARLPGHTQGIGNRGSVLHHDRTPTAAQDALPDENKRAYTQGRAHSHRKKKKLP